MSNPSTHVVELPLTSTCKFVSTSWILTGYKYVSLDYTEHSTDHWHSDHETSIDLSEADARNIICFLQEAFNLKG